MIYLTPGYRKMNENNWNDYWGHIFTPAEWMPIVEDGRSWAVDNGVFTRGFIQSEFFGFLARMSDYKTACLFVVVPDIVGNALATMDSYRQWAWKIKGLGWPVAFVAQDGQEHHDFPPEYDALFIGGTTQWKMGSGAVRCIDKAKKDGKWVHVGRVNTQRRIAYFQQLNVDSVDGTCLAYGPEVNRWRLEKQLAMRPLSGFTLEQ